VYKDKQHFLISKILSRESHEWRSTSIEELKAAWLYTCHFVDEIILPLCELSSAVQCEAGELPR